MSYEDEKDYVMRIIKEMVRILISLLLGKAYVQVELPRENKYGVSGAKLSRWKDMIDEGKINEAENMLLEQLDYNNKEDISQAIFFYEYASGKGEDFLRKCNYSEEEVLDGLKRLAVHSGCGNLIDLLA